MTNDKDICNTNTPLLLQISAASIPTLAVLIGLYVFSNGWLTIAIYYTAAPLYIIATRRTSVFRSLTRGFRPRLALLTASAFALSGPAAFLSLLIAARPDTTLADFLDASCLGGWRCLLLAIVFCSVNPIVEEAFWRGTFRTNPARPHWTDLAFAFFHVPVILKVAVLPLGLLCFVILALAAWLLRFLRYKTHGLATPYLAHLTGDISIALATCLLAYLQ